MGMAMHLKPGRGALSNPLDRPALLKRAGGIAAAAFTVAISGNIHRWLPQCSSAHR
jgi:hypothetical protein